MPSTIDQRAIHKRAEHAGTARATRPIRLTIVMTHPVQYYAPWFRHIAQRCPELDLTVLYATQPGAREQGIGFGASFEWDTPLLEGYRYRLVRPGNAGDVNCNAFWGVNVPEITTAIAASAPDVVLISGWHSITLLRALRHCRRQGIPVLYRGDTNLGNAPAGRWKRMLWRMRTGRLLRWFDAYLAVGAKAREYLHAFGCANDSIFSVPHAVDNNFFAATAGEHQSTAGRAEARLKLGLSPDDFVPLFVGKFVASKRPFDAIQAAAQLGQGTRLLMVGSGELEPQLRAAAERSGASVSWAGFLNQSQLGCAYAAADCLVLPSTTETWGLVVNEALATGLPCIVSDQCGCLPDLIFPGETGEIFPAGDVEALTRALRRVRDALRQGNDYAPACRARIGRYSYEKASAGLVQACQSVCRQKTHSVRGTASDSPRVLACCGHMVIVGGLERMTFEVLRVLREQNVPVHCIVNSWENHRIVPLAERIGASWSIGRYCTSLRLRTRNPLEVAYMVGDVLATSFGLLRDSWRFRPTHVLLPEFQAVLRNSPALLLLRAAGVHVILRVGNAPDRGTLYERLWRRVLPCFVETFVPNSGFTMQRMLDYGIAPRKVQLIGNAVSFRTNLQRGTDGDLIASAARRTTLLCVGQIAEFKGTHLFAEACIQLIRMGYDIDALIIGRLPTWPADFVRYVERIRENLQRHGLTERVRMVGERENIPGIMSVAYLLAAPIPAEESFGNVVLESQAAGLPPVIFPNGGLPELVEHEVTGYLCQESSVEALVCGLRYFLDNPAAREKVSRSCRAAFAAADHPYSPARFKRQWTGVFWADHVPALSEMSR